MKYLLLAIITLSAFAKAYTQEISAQTKTIDFKQVTASLSLDFDTKSVLGKVTTTFTALQDVNQVVMDGKAMQLVDKTPVFAISTTDTTIVFNGTFKAGVTYKATFDYSVQPTQAAYFVNNNGSEQFWTQGQGKYTSHWLPSIDDMNDKIIFDLTVTGHNRHTVIANGVAAKTLKDYNVLISEFDMEKPIASYLVALVVGNYDVKTATAASGVPLEYCYYPEDSLQVEATYRYSKEVFDFLERKIGVPFPFKVYKQVPVKDFLYAGMENASCTIFSDDFMVDAIGFTDRNYVNVNAHELAHQWFGDLVTETKSEHHWLQEGFATYYALLAEREIFGDDYFYFKLFETAEQLRALSDQGKGQKLVASGGSSLTYYQKGAWAIHILRERVGANTFDLAVQNYLKKYAYKNVTTEDFMTEVEALATVDLTDFKKNWLYQSAFQAEDALQSLKKSEFMQQYFRLQSGREAAISNKFTQLMDAVASGSDFLGQEAVYQAAQESINATLPVYKQAISSDNVIIRQAVATSLENVPQSLATDFYKLLKDDSYVTREQAMIKLWVYHQQRNDPASQRRVLDIMDGQFGFQDGNLRTLWLALSLATPEYKPSQSFGRYQELISYTQPEQPYQLRQNAFSYLRQLGSFEKESLQALVEASVHHVWRFRESARKLLKEQLKNPKNLAILKEFAATLTEKEVAYLKRVDVL
ncbi:MAG: M1 family metallopeptidase [Dokdonia donghaensis]|nr:M1 family metallopeptidase [Dokdonia donghaensis]